MSQISPVDSFKVKLIKLGKEFILPVDLVSLGVYENKEEVRRATRRNDFPFLRVFRNRILIPVESFIEYLETAAHASK